MNGIFVDERDLSHNYGQGGALFVTARRQAAESWHQERPPGRNLGEHRTVRRSGATSRGTALNLLIVRK